MRRLLLVPFAVASIAAAGCGSSGSSDTGTTAAPASTASSSAAAAPTPAPSKGKVVQVGMKNIAFTPKDITVKVGQKITWTNEEEVPHNVTADSGAKFASKTFSKGGTFSYTPEKAGLIKYECTIHPGMVGTITVEG